MRIFIIFSFLLFICSSCNTNFKRVGGKTPVSSKSQCQDLFVTIKKKWLKHNEYNCFFYDTGLIQKMQKNEYYLCLIDRDISEIIKLLGKPTTMDKDTMSYYIGKVCGEGDYPSIYVLQIALANGKTSSMQVMKNFDD